MQPIARRAGRWEGRGPAPREVIKGRSGSLSKGEGERYLPASVQPRRDPATLLGTKPGGFYPRRQKEPSRSGDRCQPCPGELGAVGVKDGAQPTSCPPPPPAGKMLLSPLLPEGPFCLPPHHPSAPCTTRFLRNDFSISLKEGKSKRRNRYTKGPQENSSSRGTGAWRDLTMPKNWRGGGWSQ